MNKKIAINILLILTFMTISIVTSPQISLAENDHEHGHNESNHSEEEGKEDDHNDHDNHEEESSTTISEESAKNAGIKINQAKSQTIFEATSLT